MKLSKKSATCVQKESKWPLVILKINVKNQYILLCIHSTFAIDLSCTAYYCNVYLYKIHITLGTRGFSRMQWEFSVLAEGRHIYWPRCGPFGFNPRKFPQQIWQIKLPKRGLRDEVWNSANSLLWWIWLSSTGFGCP